MQILQKRKRDFFGKKEYSFRATYWVIPLAATVITDNFIRSSACHYYILRDAVVRHRDSRKDNSRDIEIWRSLQKSLQQLVRTRYEVYGEFAGVGKVLCYMEYLRFYISICL